VEDESAPELLPAFLACNSRDATGLAGALIPLAEAGNPRAQAWLAYLLVGGADTSGGYDFRARANPQRAARWYAKAAEQGLPSAMHDYGVLLEHGLGVPVDEAAARGWHAKAAERGFAPAQP
jgi:TPR repeat protein